MVPVEVLCQVQQLLAREAHLLDRHEYDAWLELFTDDISYTMPLTEYVQGDAPPAGHLVINDNMPKLAARIAKDKTGYSHVESPQSLTCHLITNVLVEEIEGSIELEVHSAFLVRQARKLRGESWWAGRRRDVVRPINGGWKIASREIRLDSPILPRGISIFF